MENKPKIAPRVAPPRPLENWTRPDDYFSALARRRTARKAREPAAPRTQPETPRFSLSTLPFLVLFTALLIITIALFAAAWPSGSPPPRNTVQARELGTAAKGWYQKAERDFHKPAR